MKNKIIKKTLAALADAPRAAMANAINSFDDPDDRADAARLAAALGLRIDPSEQKGSNHEEEKRKD